jgi:hypothetical protein
MIFYALDFKAESIGNFGLDAKLKQNNKETQMHLLRTSRPFTTEAKSKASLIFLGFLEVVRGCV